MSVAALGNFTSAAGQTYTFSVFQESFVVDLNISTTSIASLYLFGSVTAAVLIIFVGRYLDLLGPRVICIRHDLFGFGGFLVVVCQFCMATICWFCHHANYGAGCTALDFQ